MEKPIINQLIILAGNVASGKSAFANKLMTDFYNDFPRILLSSDSFRAVIGENENDQTVSKQVFEVLEWNAEYFLKQGYDVIIDSTAKTPKARKKFIDIAKKVGIKYIKCCYFKVPIEICKERNSKRERVVPDHIIEKFQQDLVEPTLSEGFTGINFINEDGLAVGGAIPHTKTTTLNHQNSCYIWGVDYDNKTLESCKARFSNLSGDYTVLLKGFPDKK